jgi:hypothetical protein
MVIISVADSCYQLCGTGSGSSVTNMSKTKFMHKLGKNKLFNKVSRRAIVIQCRYRNLIRTNVVIWVIIMVVPEPHRFGGIGVSMQCGAVPYSISTVHIMMFNVKKKIVKNGSIFDPFKSLAFFIIELEQESELRQNFIYRKIR